MKRILVNLRELSLSQSELIINALKFLPERINKQFIFIYNPKKLKTVQLEKIVSDKISFNCDFIEESISEKSSLTTIKLKNQCDAVLNFNQIDENENISGFNQVITPLIDIIYLAEDNQNEYYIPDENLLAISLKRLCTFLKGKNCPNISFLRSQISFFSDIEDDIIARLNQDFDTSEIFINDFQNLSDIKSRNVISLFPHNLFALIKLFLPSSYANQDHRYDFPLIQIDLNQNNKTILRQNIRYSAAQIIHLIDFQESNPNNYAYKSFAEIYDHYMDHVAYHNWVDFVLYQYQMKYHKKPDSILDLACGTASISKLLIDKKFKVFASDQSPEMLDIAYDKSEKLHLFQADMTDFQLEEKTDLIILLFDSINYLNHKDQIIKLFNTIQNNLSEKGMFIFDISTLFNSKEYFDGFINVEEYNKHFFIHRADYLPHKKKQETHLNIFSQAFLGYRREDEIHQQKVWRVNEIIDMIDQCQLSLKGIYDLNKTDNLLNESPNRIDTEFSRIFFILTNEKK